MMIQCEDRAHRIGQNSCVAVHYLVAKDTMDEWVWSAVCKKVHDMYIIVLDSISVIVTQIHRNHYHL